MLTFQKSVNYLMHFNWIILNVNNNTIFDKLMTFF